MIDDIVKEGDEGIRNSTIVEEKLPYDYEVEQSIKMKKKVMAIDSTIYTATYVGLMKTNKKQYKLTQADQFELLYKTMLIMAIQFFFIYCVIYVGKLSFTLYNNVALQFCLFFTTLLLHLGNLPLFRSGLYMMKYSLCHPE
jgi:hypothetical protein